MSQALQELDLKIDSCPEIFAALRSLTSRAFDLIAVDWDEGPEASFLLKTARDLKSNRAAFVVVIGRSDATAALQQAGADLVLSKPLNSDRVRHDLLTNKDFVERMKDWLPQVQVRQTTTPNAGKELWSTSVPGSEPKPFVEPAPAPVSVPFGAPAENLTFASLDNGFIRKSPQRKPSQTRSAGLDKSRASRSRGTDRQSAMLSVAAIIVTFFAVGYVFTQSVNKAGNAIVEASRTKWEQTLNWFHSSPTEVQAAVVRPEPEGEPLPDTDPPLRHQKVLTASADTTASLSVNGAPEPLAIAPAASTTSEPAHFEAARAQQRPIQAAAIVANMPVAERRIPESISAPFPGVATVRNVASKITPALLDALQPITVPEQLSEKLLLAKVEPNYPQRALQAGLQGPVVLQAWIGTDGKIRDLKLVRGSLLLGQAACDAVKQWRYKPYLLNGQAVEAQTFVTVDFKLP